MGRFVRRTAVGVVLGWLIFLSAQCKESGSVVIDRNSHATELQNFRQAEGMPVLCYHQIVTEHEYSQKPTPFAVTINQFREQMKLVHDLGYRTVTLSEFKDFVSGKGKPPRLGKYKGILISFDDGNNDFEKYALPIMQKFDFKAVLFIYPTIIMARPKKKRATTFAELKRLEAMGHETESHALWHPMLNTMTLGEQSEQLRKSREILEKRVGGTVEYLAYPFGLFNTDTFSALETNGYVGAFTTFYGENVPGERLFSLRRYMIVKADSLKIFQRKLTAKSLPVQNISPPEGALLSGSTKFSARISPALGKENLSVRVFSSKPQFEYDETKGLITFTLNKAIRKKITLVQLEYKERDQTYIREILFNNQGQVPKTADRKQKQRT